MGGGNAQKTATSRARHLEKAQSEKNSGGGKAGMQARIGTDQNAAMVNITLKVIIVQSKLITLLGCCCCSPRS